MAVRTPLKIYGTGLQETSAAEKTAIINRMVYLYYTDPSVTLSVVGSSGSLGAITDTRKQAGASNTDVTNYDTAAETANISTVTVTYDKITEATSSLSAPADTSNIRFPLYQSGGNLHSMTLQDMYDTFSEDAMTAIISAQPYKIHTSTSAPSGYTLVSGTAVFSDTRANVGAYTAAGIGETQDQPTTVTNYYLHKKNASSSASGVGLMYVDASQAIREYTNAAIDAILKEVVRYTAVNLSSHRLRFFTSGSGTTCGSGMANTIMNGSGNYQTRYVNTNDYRAQEFPNGTAVTAATHYLKARKA